jgi:Trypsin-like peptidase domain
VTGAKIHPAYQAFREAVAETAQITGKAITVQSSFDVAELFVGENAKLAPPIPVASPEELNSVNVGDAMAYVGYPANFALNKSVQQLRIGYVSGATDFMGVAQAKGGELIYHSAPAEGGTSGSPILNDKGEVIAVHSGGERRLVGEETVVTGSGTFYAQSAGLIPDITEGWSDAKLQTAKSEWQNDALFLAKRDQLWALLQNYKDPNSLEAAPSFQSQAKLAVGQTRSDEGETILHWNAAEPGTYMAFAIPNKNEKLSLRLKMGGVVLQSPIYIDAAPMAVFKIADATQVTFALSGKPDQNYWLQVVKLQERKAK